MKKGHLRKVAICKNKIGVIIVVSCIGLIITTFTLLMIMCNYRDKRDTVLFIDKEPVTLNEFKKAMDKNKPYIYQYFKEKNISAESVGFWENNYNGEVPLEVLKKKSKNDIIRIKIQQIMAKDKGIIRDIAYDKILENFKQFNKDRKEAVKKNKVIYGPVEYTEDQYYDKVTSEMVSEYKKKLTDEGNFTDEELKKIYETEKATYFKMSSSINVSRITVKFDGNNAEIREKAQNITNDLKNRIEAGEEFETLSKKHGKEGGIYFEFVEQTFDRNTAKMDAMRWPQLLNEAQTLEKGEVSRIVEMEDSFSLMKCNNKSKNEYKKFEDVKDQIKNIQVEKEYTKIIEKMTKELPIVIVENVYQNIKY